MPKSEDPKITRIKASGSSTKSGKSTKKPATSKKTTPVKNAKTSKTTVKAKAVLAKKHQAAHKRASAVPADKKRGPLRAIKEYFVGAWYELRQVRWPDRKATWSMTGALLIFTALFITLILLLDTGFQYLFKLLIG